jgi:hypothetical protein
MSAFVEQVKHNESLLYHLDTTFPDKYFDWKITLTFYCCLHLIKELARVKGVSIGDSHIENLNNLNPLPRAGVNPKLKVSKTQYDFYNDTYQYSRVARYTGITDYTVFELQRKSDYAICKASYANMKLYYISRGVVI